MDSLAGPVAGWGGAGLGRGSPAGRWRRFSGRRRMMPVLAGRVEVQ